MQTFCLTHRIVLATKVLLPWIGILVAATVLAVLPAEGGPVSISGTGQTLVGTSPSVFSTVSGSASLDIIGNTLTLKLYNTSPTDTRFKAEGLSSFYFDIVRGTQRPTLTYQSADGPIYRLSTSGSDTRYWYTPQTFTTTPQPSSDLRAFNTSDGTWQFKSMNPAFSPFLGFGIGTVGNGLFTSGSNNFDGNVVQGPGNGDTMIDFSIYRSLSGGDITPGTGLNRNYLLMNSGTFTFGIKNDGIDWSTADIRNEAMFGFGTGPDGKIIVAPEPSAYVIALLGVAAFACRQRFRRNASPPRSPAP